MLARAGQTHGPTAQRYGMKITKITKT